MKWILFIAALLCCCDIENRAPARVTVEIAREGNVFEIYEAGELVLEFSPANSDSVDINLLNYIFETALWHRSQNRPDRKTGSSSSIFKAENTGAR